MVLCVSQSIGPWCKHLFMASLFFLKRENLRQSFFLFDTFFDTLACFIIFKFITTVVTQPKKHKWLALTLIVSANAKPCYNHILTNCSLSNVGCCCVNEESTNSMNCSGWWQHDVDSDPSNVTFVAAFPPFGHQPARGLVLLQSRVHQQYRVFHKNI